ncbi:MAG: 6-phosphogluconolactonase [Buchnera aphidicola (Kaburagia rhusicola ensigallis)]
MKQILYVSSANSQQIEVWEINPDMSLNLIQVVKVDGEPQPILIVKNTKRLYLGIRPKFSIYTYQIETDGTLTQIGHSNIFCSINHFEIDKTERYLFSSSYHFNCINVSAMNSYGIPQPIIQTIHEIKGCHASLMHYNNKNLFVSSLKKDRIYLYNFTNSGVLLENKCKFISVKNNSGPRHMIFQKSVNRLFSVNELNGTISIWYVNNSCNIITFLKNVNVISHEFMHCAWSSDLHISLCEEYLYVSNRSNSSIAIIKNDKDVNNIKIIGYIQTETQPRSFCIDTTGKILIVSGEISNSISVYNICSKTGLLTFKNRYPTGSRPVWISIYTI